MTLPDTDSLNTYGGELADYAPIEDPTTDRSADAANMAFASVAMMTHTIPRAIVQFAGHATTPTRTTHDAVWGNTSGVAPTIAKTGTGVYTVTWPSSVNDELGEAHTVSVRYPTGSALSSTAYHVQCVATSANVVTVYTFTAGGVADNLAGVQILVVAY